MFFSIYVLCLRANILCVGYKKNSKITCYYYYYTQHDIIIIIIAHLYKQTNIFNRQMSNAAIFEGSAVSL